MTVLINDPFCIFAVADEAKEGFKEACGLKGNLAVVFMDIQ